MCSPLAGIAVAAVLLAQVSAQALSADDAALVAKNLATGAQQSWELGTRAQALLDLYVPDFSVFSSTELPPPTSVPSNTTSAIAPVFSIAQNVVSALKLNSSSPPTALVNGDGAAGDPASIGVAVLLANWTGQGAGDKLDYGQAATSQLEYTLNVVPRTSDGAISHRAAQVQLWSDSVFMVPPFLAYYGVLTGNTTLMNEAYNQIKLYRNYLRDSSAKNLWKHIVLGNDTQDGANDPGHWSTGMKRLGSGRYAAGHCNNEEFSVQQGFFESAKGFSQLGQGNPYCHVCAHCTATPSFPPTILIPNALIQDSTNIFTNYADQPISTSGMFYDTASTTLIASTVYRAALLVNDHSHLPNAEKCREALFATSPFRLSQPSIRGSSGSASVSASSTAPASSPTATASSMPNMVHFTNDGWLTPVVNPHSFGVEGSDSPEGEAFVLELQAAYDEWVAVGSPGANAARRTASAATGWAWAAGCVIIGGLLAYT
ncbi:hypothetical protein MSAN_01001500 [Mycena sanguinolenta]|uniref:Uncharacterized protein n=1 Tax=Mycena sanguinolenta TaxID=230812 RepID=A0A8H6YRC9_9AGAR|nr:hypothetical protein MSAN_01001500 [Mycena sanguinolenta]